MLNELSRNGESINAMAHAMRLLADPTRLRLLALLEHRERNVSDLCDTLRIPQPSVSHHLGLLRRAGVVTNRRSGKQIFYALNPAAVHNLSGRLEMALPMGPNGQLHVQLAVGQHKPATYHAAAV